ncbi:hypothetical protein [Nocardia sp. NPDC050793]|uniref:hypothetical protein n=1 Tax=Nocardia sp. NPDC050793 TaxID=3155159 RepID=UPI003401FB53
MKTIMTGRRFITAVALAAVCTGGLAVVGTGSAGAETPTSVAVAVDSAVPWEFERDARYYARVSCYFETLDRKNTRGPQKFEGSGKTEVDAVNDAKRKAQGTVERGWKLKHCRTDDTWKK